MRAMALGVLILAFTQASLQAGDPCGFKSADRWMLGVYAVLHLMDYRQTSNIDNEGGRELNPILGSHPTQGDINIYFLLTGLAVVGAACLFDEPYRGWFLSAEIGIKSATVYWNYRMGF